MDPPPLSVSNVPPQLRCKWDDTGLTLRLEETYRSQVQDFLRAATVALGCRVMLLDWLSVRAAVLLNYRAKHWIRHPTTKSYKNYFLQVGGRTLDVTQMLHALLLTGCPVPRQTSFCELL